MCRELHLQSRHHHTQTQRDMAHTMNGFVYEIRIMQSIEFYLLSLSCLVSLFTFTDYTLHHAKQQYQQKQEQQIDDMFGQFIIMRKSKFENIAGIAGVCQKVLPIFRRCLKNEKGVANWNWVTVFGTGTLHCLHPIAQMSVQSTVIRHHRFAK